MWVFRWIIYRLIIPPFWSPCMTWFKCIYYLQNEACMLPVCKLLNGNVGDIIFVETSAVGTFLTSTVASSLWNFDHNWDIGNYARIQIYNYRRLLREYLVVRALFHNVLGRSIRFKICTDDSIFSQIKDSGSLYDLIAAQFSNR